MVHVCEVDGSWNVLEGSFDDPDVAERPCKRLKTIGTKNRLATVARASR